MTTPGALDTDERVATIEAAFERHWRHFGGYPGASLHDEDGVLWFASPIPHLPYNWVIRTLVPAELEPDAVIERVASSFRLREVPYMWIHRPSDRPTDLGHRLAHHGLDLVETALGMDLDLDGWVPESPEADVEIRHVDAPGADPDGLQHYEALIRTYWSVPEEARHLIEGLNRHWIGERNQGARLVAYIDGVPVGKAFANLEDIPAWVAIYGVAVRPEARGRGIATALMHRAIGIGRELGAGRAVLHSSTMAASMYRRMGFTERCRLPVYASAALFGTHHH